MGLILAAIPAASALISVVGCRPAQPVVPDVPPARAPDTQTTSFEKNPIPSSQRDLYAGSEACIQCHKAQAEQLDTHHFRTMARVNSGEHAALFSRRDSVVDPQRGVRYRPAKKGDHLLVEAEQGGATEQIRADWVFGSGNRCFTYVGQYDSSAVELRISYYRKANQWHFTPGQQPKFPITTPVGRQLSQGDAVACLNCHTTAAVVDDGVPNPDQSILGIGCESCHGPGQRHIQAVQRREPDLRMARLAQFPERVTTELCGSCHRTTATGGDPHDPTTQGQLPRLQGPALMLSRCFKESNGRLTCMTCHNPHRDSTRVSRADYNRICGSCHVDAGAKQTTCPKAPRGDCVSCHMPSQAVEMPTGPRFSTHWIKVWGSQASRESTSKHP